MHFLLGLLVGVGLTFLVGLVISLKELKELANSW